ncbi:hypothetical protein ACIGEZ_05445 [Streptomyces sp. NPDC085481]|uniref:hypothetical protein n=1 Tax=Streptomyces sp. NPDC085481 TaxID=3365727 RepID=UPI0037D0006E
MHPDIHLTLHHLTAAELRQTAATTAPSTPVRVQLGWRLVEFGLKLTTPRTSRPVICATA